ncbi:hypothetical protein BH09VER1_BH09VER1_53980 [soil metagenome]
MISNLLIVIGVAVLSAALRSFQHPLLFRLGTLCVVTTSFLAGWLLGDSIGLGIVLAASWLFLPWLEILTRVRRLRLPLERTLGTRTPPNRNTFPGFNEITSEIEEAGFEHTGDLGWDFEENRHFYRILSDPARKLQAGICLSEQQDFSFYYITLISRAADGRSFMTWNYPFSYGLKLQPRLKLNRFPGRQSFATMLEAHQHFLAHEGVTPAQLVDESPEETMSTMQKEMRAQIAHNLDLGLLKRDGEHFIRYTIRGMFYLWFQFLRDLVRLS